MWPGVGDEGAADFAAVLGAHRNVLQIRLRRRQPPGRGRGERVARMHAMRRRIDEAGQRVGIGRFQFRDLPPVENLLRQLVALLGEFFEQPRAGRPLPGLGLGAALKAELAEQNVADLLRGADIDRLAGKLVDLGFEARRFLREFAGQPRQHLPVDRNAAPLHVARARATAAAPASHRRRARARRRAAA